MREFDEFNNNGNYVEISDYIKNLSWSDISDLYINCERFLLDGLCEILDVHIYNKNMHEFSTKNWDNLVTGLEIVSCEDSINDIIISMNNCCELKEFILNIRETSPCLNNNHKIWKNILHCLCNFFGIIFKVDIDRAFKTIQLDDFSLDYYNDITILIPIMEICEGCIDMQILATPQLSFCKNKDFLSLI